jgi:hypothetical protein
MLTLNQSVVLRSDYQATYDEFVGFWKEQYDFPNPEWYTDNIGVPRFTHDNLHYLFRWKNGMDLSAKKRTSFDKIAKDLNTINLLRNEFDHSTFESVFGFLSPIWKIFLRHIIDPGKNPIFDQHVYRSYRFIQHRDSLEIPGNKKKEEVYHKKYVPFYQAIEKKCPRYSTKEIDEALWAFGRFLSIYPKMIA